MLSIGEFSRVCKVTTRSLRHYDDINLIKPKYVNEENGYRFYEVCQIKDMLLVSRLKEYNFSLEEIKEVLKVNSREFTLSKILSVDEMEVKVYETKDINIVYSRQIMSTKDYGKHIGKVFEYIAENKLTVKGAPMSIYYDDEFNEEQNDTEVAVEVKESTKETRVLKGCLCAVTTYKGPYSSLSNGYGRILQWIDENNYEIAGHPFEKYLNGPMDGGEIVTEIYFPIKNK